MRVKSIRLGTIIESIYCCSKSGSGGLSSSIEDDYCYTERRSPDDGNCIPGAKP